MPAPTLFKVMPLRSMPQPQVVLTFAGSDPTGGAGIQADLLTFAALGCHGVSVATAITVQDTAGVEDLMVLDAARVRHQARTLLDDIKVAAFKVGMIGSAANVEVIVAIVADYPDIPLVVDPVLASGRGDPLAQGSMIEALRALLLPRTTILTPNSIEARELANTKEDDEPSLDACARRLSALGCGHVLITGTHENTLQVVNTLYDGRGRIRADSWDRLPGSYHGSGCTLASAVAANLANGMSMVAAVYEAQAYTWQTLSAAFRPGRGQHIPDRFFKFRAGVDDDGH